ncbi:MAG: hexose kinase [Clostridia bacterium]|nr:hexose kinase [Clostridia bacterium]
MIHVLCLNPAIDKFYEIDGFAAGEDYPGQRPRCINGGKGVNVARVLAQLGEQPTLYAFVGDGAKALEQEMRSLCRCVFFPVVGSCRTTINILDRANDRETVITEAGPAITAANVSQLLIALEEMIAPGDIVVCSGSLIAGAPADLYAQISRLCAQSGAVCVLDCNAKTLSASLDGACYALGKPNERELCALMNAARTQEPEEIAQLARRLMPPYNALLVSMGGAGGVYVTREGAAYSPGAKVNVVSTVGSGDACLAGAVYAMARGYNMEETLRLAMACGAANAQREETGVGKGADVFALKERIAAKALRGGAK